MALRKLLAVLAVSLPLAALAQTAEPPKPAEPAPAAAPAAAPAPAPAPAVQVYGTLNVNLQYTEAKDATAGEASNISPRFAIGTDSTSVGVRGTLELAHGYKAVYQCETQANLDGEDVRGLCNRNSRVGLSAFWGTLFYGNWDTPFKNGHYGTKADDPFGNTDVFGFQGLMGSPGYGSRSSAFNAAGATTATPVVRTASFDQRAANSVAYWSPKIAGLLTVKAQYSVPDFRSANGIVSQQLASVGVNLDRGPFSVVAVVEYHEDSFGLGVINATDNTGTTPSKDMGWRLAAGYDLPLGVGTLNVMGMFEQLSYAQDDATAGFKDYSRMAWLLGAKFRTGNHELRGRFSQAMGPDITAATGTTLAATAEDDLAAQSFAVGYAYHFAKSTQVFLYYTQIMNEDRARYTFGLGGSAALAPTGGPPAGSDPSAMGAGIRLAF